MYYEDVPLDYAPVYDDQYEYHVYDASQTVGDYSTDRNDFEPILSPFSENFKDVASSVNSAIAHNPFSKENMFKNDVFDRDSKGDGSDLKSDTMFSGDKPFGTNFFSFGFDSEDGLFGDDPPNESGPEFGRVTYEYDFTNTHLNPSAVEVDKGVTTETVTHDKPASDKKRDSQQVSPVKLDS